MRAIRNVPLVMIRARTARSTGSSGSSMERTTTSSNRSTCARRCCGSTVFSGVTERPSPRPRATGRPRSARPRLRPLCSRPREARTAVERRWSDRSDRRRASVARPFSSKILRACAGATSRADRSASGRRSTARSTDTWPGSGASSRTNGRAADHQKRANRRLRLRQRRLPALSAGARQSLREPMRAPFANTA